MHKLASEADKHRPARIRLTVLVTAAILSVLAGFQVHSIWIRLPGVRLQRLDGETYQQALQVARGRMSVEAREGLIAANLSSLFTAVQREPDTLPANRNLIQQMVARLRHTQIGRVQMAAFIMLELEHTGTPLEQWWPTLQPLLRGLERAGFAHFLPELIEHRTGVFEALGFGPGSARLAAEQNIGHPHGPLLQFLTDRLDKIALTRRAVADGSAETCQLLTWRLLQQWTLDPGPAGLRLLAADLLAESLTRSHTNTTPATSNQLAQELQEWRERYHSCADLSLVIGRNTIPLLSPHLGPNPTPLKYRDLFEIASWLLWSVSATCAAALVTLVCLPWCSSATLIMPYRYMETTLRCLITVTGILSLYFIWSSLMPEHLATDLRRLSSEELGWPRQPLVAAAAMLVMIALEAAGRMDPAAPRRARLGRVTYSAARIWLILSMTTLLLGLHTSRVRHSYETALRTALDNDEAQAVANITLMASDQLDGLRAWDPLKMPGFLEPMEEQP